MATKKSPKSWSTWWGGRKGWLVAACTGPTCPFPPSPFTHHCAQQYLGEAQAAVTLHAALLKHPRILPGTLQAAHSLRVLSLVPVHGAQVVEGPEQILREVVLPVEGRGSDALGTSAPYTVNLLLLHTQAELMGHVRTRTHIE